MFRVEKMNLLNGREINLEVNGREIIQILGDNGTGKSLLLKSLARLVPSTFVSLNLQGRESHSFNISEWRSKVMYLSSDVYFDSDMTARDFFYYPFKFEVHKNSSSLLNLEKHFPLSDERMVLLSSGQKQLLSVLRSLSLGPDILLFDETFAHLDLHTRSKVTELISSWCFNSNKIVMYISHVSLKFNDHCHRVFQPFS